MKTIILFVCIGCIINMSYTQDSIKITNLYDAFGKEYPGLTQSFGFSALIEYKGKTILFDAGSNADIFKNNVTALKLNLKKIDMVIVSHSHFDHINGLDYLLTQNPKVKIYFPYDIFWGAPSPFDATGQEPSVKDSLPEEMKYFHGKSTKFVIDQTGRFWNSNVEYVKESKEILPGIKLVTTSSPFIGYFTRYPNLSFVPELFKNGSGNSGATESGLAEISLSLKSKAGEILVVGCSHSGIENIVSEAKKITQNNIQLLYGGLHLLPYKRDDLIKLTSVLKNDLGVNKIAPAHCTGHLAFKLLKDEYKSNFIFAGLGESFYIKDEKK